MKRLSAFSAFLLLFLSVHSFAQRPGGGGAGRPTNPGNSSTPNIGTREPLPTPEMERPVFISGKVVLADGSQISEPAAIETICNSRRRIEAYTDSHGSFSFELKKKSDNQGMQMAENSDFGDGALPKNNNNFQWRNCEVLAVLPGFSSDSVQLVLSASSIEATNVGRIVLRPLGNVEGSILSVTTLAAPDDAKKALDKAREQEKKNKLDDARRSLEKAVQIYPQFAAAWTELGRVQHMAHDDVAAKHSYEQSLAADPKYAKPYLGLAQLAVEAHEWQPLVDITSKLLALNSVSFPMAWYLNAAAQYNLQNYEAAETSARSGLKLDSDHRVPRLEYLLGLLLANKRDYAQAAEHMRQFLKISNQPAEVAEAQKQLAQIEQMSANAAIPVENPQK